MTGAPDISYALILMGCWKRDAKPHGCAEACELAERSILYQQARIAALESRIQTHDAGCQALCGIGDQEPVACGHRPYFLNNGRRCPHCPVHDQIGLPE